MFSKLADARAISTIMRFRYALAAGLCALLMAVAVAVSPITRGAKSCLSFRQARFHWRAPDVESA